MMTLMRHRLNDRAARGVTDPGRPAPPRPQFHLKATLRRPLPIAPGRKHLLVSTIAKSHRRMRSRNR
jgi:hypothetical protein